MTELRPARAADARAMAVLRYAFRTELAPPTETEQEFVERATGWLADRLERGSWTGWLACQQDEPVGLVLVHLLEKVPNPVAEPESLGYLSSLYVRPHCRGRGVGERLLRAALDSCRDGCVDTVVLWPSPRSVHMYLRHGFRRQGDVMELRWLAESSPGLRQTAGLIFTAGDQTRPMPCVDNTSGHSGSKH
jgi:ribosomal protein S18 acetylase RimI-like enzyme